ncbi:MAG: non-ribosomal peptide synthetase, partial [bacterium]|nr:non-ribosomal peptide synthetase [bacterium]
ICAYFVPGEDFENNDALTEIIRKKLALSLPHYMIPGYFVHLDAIPLTLNGKVDTRALPEPTFKQIAGGGNLVAPRDEIEEKLAAIWAAVLGIEQSAISTNADFFQLGGHSLKATIMSSKIHKEFHSQIPLAEIFNTSTISGLAQIVKDSRKEKFTALEPVEKKEYYAVSSPQKRLYVLQQMEAGNTAYNMPAAIPLEDEIATEELESTFGKLIARHESLRTSFHIVDGHVVQKVNENCDFKIENIETTKNESETIIDKFTRPFDLSKEPLLRVGLMKIEPARQQVLLLDMHHIITDGTSQRLLQEEFFALRAGEEPAPLKLQYKDFSQWQSGEKRTRLVKRQELYWINQFSGELPVLDIPTDYSRPAIQDFEGADVSFALSQGESPALKRIAREADATIYMVILAIYTILLSKLSGREDIIVGTPIAARRHADIQNIIGMFINTLAIRNYPCGNKTFKEFLTELKENVLQAFEHQEYQFEELVEKISLPRDTGRNPLFDVMFNLLNHWEETAEWAEGPDPVESSYKHGKSTAKFDLTLNAAEKDEKIFFNFNYGTKLYKAGTIERFIGYFKKLVGGVIKNQDIRISHLEIISEEERKRLLLDFNDTVAQYPRDKTIHQLFEEQAIKSPDSVAVVAESRSPGLTSITYRQLNEEA